MYYIMLHLANSGVKGLSTAKRRIDCNDVDFSHRHYRIKRPFGGLTVIF